MEDISKKVLKVIREENVKPIPKWHFVLKSSFIWILFGVNLILGVIGTAIIIFLFADNDVVFDASLVSNIWERLLLMIPIAWIILTIIFLLVAYYNFKNTEGGYRFTALKIFALNIVIILILGFVVYITGGARRINNFFTRYIPHYSSTLDTRAMVWMRPEKGYLAGDIVSIEGKNLALLDLNGKTWNVEFSGAQVKPIVDLAVGERIKIIGEMSSENSFVAFEIRPWNGMRRNMQEN